MPPKSCRVRDTTNLDEYARDPTSIGKNLFAKALYNDSFLESFKGKVGYSECIFSYPESDWYSVYLLDDSGNKYFDTKSGRVAQYYFRLNIGPNGKDAFTMDGTTELSKTDLVGKKACMINENGNCVLAKEKPTRLEKPETGRTTAKKTSSQPDKEVEEGVMAKLSSLSLTPRENSESREQAPRQYFEQMKDKMLIVQWMVEKMSNDDLVECVKRGSLSPEDVRRAEEVSGTAPQEKVVEEAVKAASGLPQNEVKKMFKRISMEELVSQVNQLPVDRRKQGILDLCRKAGKKLKIANDKRGKERLYDFEGDVIDDDDALELCATVESERARKRLLNRWSSVMKEAASLKKSGKIPPFEIPRAEVIKVQQTAEDIIKSVNDISDPEQRRLYLADIAKPYGFRLGEDKRKKIRFFDKENDIIDDDDVLFEVAALRASLSGFGKKKRKTVQVRNFTKAAKICKGKPNYRKCMTKTLGGMYSFGSRKKDLVEMFNNTAVMNVLTPFGFGKKQKVETRLRRTIGGSKRVSKTRMSPEQSATTQPVGIISVGADGNIWKVKKTKTGVKRWVKNK